MRLRQTGHERRASTDFFNYSAEYLFMGQTRRVLLIENDTYLAKLLHLHLRDEGYVVHHAADGNRGMELLLTAHWDALVLDLIRPRREGLKICQRIRALGLRMPIIIASTHATERHRILGLELGADVYMAKPYSMRELTVRLHALIRHADEIAGKTGSRRLEIDGLLIDPGTRLVMLNGVRLALTPCEFDMLYVLARRPNKVISRLELMLEVWGHVRDDYAYIVGAHINRLRWKMEGDTSTPRRIVTIWKRGYKLVGGNSTSLWPG